MTTLFAAAAIVVVLDCSSKALIRAHVGRPRGAGKHGVSIGIRPSYNRSWIFAGLPRLVPVVVLLTAVVSAAMLVSGHPHFGAIGSRIGLGAALGGAGGNLIDHLRHGAVRDFICVPPLAPFNLADVAIVGGLILALTSAAGGG